MMHLILIYIFVKQTNLFKKKKKKYSKTSYVTKNRPNMLSSTQNIILKKIIEINRYKNMTKSEQDKQPHLLSNELNISDKLKLIMNYKFEAEVNSNHSEDKSEQLKKATSRLAEIVNNKHVHTMKRGQLLQYLENEILKKLEILKHILMSKGLKSFD